MKLRTRLALTLAVSTIPLAVAIAWWQEHGRLQDFEKTTAELAVARMAAGERELCEAAPERWPYVRRPHGPWRGGHRGRGRPGSRLRPVRGAVPDFATERGFRVFAYDATLSGANPDAPPFDPELREELEAGAPHASRPSPVDDALRLVAVRMPWEDGPCAVLLVQRPAENEDVVRLVGPALGVSLAALVMAVVAAGPLVRRTRQLTTAVEQSGVGGDAPVAVAGGDELAELARAFEEQRKKIRAQMEELAARDRALRQYVASTTHDVMLPLTVIQGHLVALEESLARAADAGAGADVERTRSALEECHYLGSLVHNLDVVAKLEGVEEPIEMHAVDFADLVERVVARNAPYAASRGVSLDHAVPEKPLHALGDVTLLERALGNVVQNAVRYNGKDGHVAVILERAAERFVVRVLDDGAGLSDAELSRITEHGFRGDAARTRHPTGMGLGLAIAKDVVDRHGFDLSFARPEEGGLEVRVEGPAHQAS